MKLISIRCFLSCFLTISYTLTFAQQELKESENRIRHDIFALANDSMFGREAGTSSEYKAALYIEKSFRDAHLQPYNKETGSFLKPFQFGGAAFKTAKFGTGSVQFKKGVDFGAVAGSGNGTISSVKVVDYSLLQRDDFLKDKVVLMDMKGKQNAVAGSFQKTLQQISAATEKGASAILLFNASRMDFNNRLFNPDSMPSFTIPVVYLTSKPLKVLSDMPEPACSLEVEIDFIRPTAYNVIGFVDNGAVRTVVIGGHFDHVGTPGENPKVGDPGIHNGADDNASGACAVMELARWVSRQKGLKYNYLFIAFTAEEKGLYGSWNFCNSPDFKKYDFAWMLNLDMVGRLGWKGKGKEKLTVLATHSSRKWKTLYRNTPHPGMKLFKIKGGPAFSDHYPFIKHKVPVIYFTTGLEKEYHKPADDPELINCKGEAEIVDYIEHIILNAEQLGDPGFRKLTTWQDIKTVLNLFILKRG
jgi:aminopeptidase YwaD